MMSYPIQQYLRRTMGQYRRRIVTTTVKSVPRSSFTTTTSNTTISIPYASDHTNITPDPSLVDATNAPSDFDPSCAVVYRDIVTSVEADLISQEILGRMKRRRYEKGHWDAVITGYKEVELSDGSFPCGESDHEILTIFKRIQQFLATKHLQPRFYPHDEIIQWLSCHAIDLKREGELKAHVDSIRFSGELVAGLSLLSHSIMRLVPEDGDNDNNPKKDQNLGHVDLYLPPQSLYVLTGVGRYRYSHQLLPDSSVFVCSKDGARTIVMRDQRLSVIFRDAKRNVDNQDNGVDCEP